MIQQVIGKRHYWDIDFFSFAQVPTVKKEDLEAVGIKSHADVGRWIVETMRNILDQSDLAEKLEASFYIQDSSCHSQ